MNSELVSVLFLSEVLLVSLRVFCEPGNKIIVFTTFTVVNSSFVVSGVELESWVSTNLDSFSFVSSGIEISNNEVRSFDMFTKFLPFRSKCLAMTTPGGIIFDKDILCRIFDDFIILDSNNDLNRSIVALRDGFGFEMGSDFILVKIVEEINNIGSSERGHFTRVVEFFHFGFWVNNTESWKIIFGNSNELSKTFLDSSFDT